jgi:hypothetical protein
MKHHKEVIHRSDHCSEARTAALPRGRGLVCFAIITWKVIKEVSLSNFRVSRIIDSTNFSTERELNELGQSGVSLRKLKPLTSPDFLLCFHL